jgi:hypothetical protein
VRQSPQIHAARPKEAAMTNIDKRWLLALVVSVAAGAAVTARVLRRRRWMAQHHDHAEDLKVWENEGGNLPPPAPTPAMPAHG